MTLISSTRFHTGNQSSQAKSSQVGFTLIEIMIVVTILGILAAISYPSYQSYVIKTKRADMMVEMQQVASRIESNKINYKRYDRIPLSSILSGTVASGGSMNFPISGTALYTVIIGTGTWGEADWATSTRTLGGTDWTIRATPITTQQMKGDGTLTLNTNGQKCRDTLCGMNDEWSH